MNTLTELKQQQKLIQKQISKIGPIIEGSISQSGWHCKSKKCKCNTIGELHRSLILCWQEKGKSYAKHIPIALQNEVATWVENRKKLKAMIRDLAAIQREIFYLLRDESKMR